MGKGFWNSSPSKDTSSVIQRTMGEEAASDMVKDLEVEICMLDCIIISLVREFVMNWQRKPIFQWLGLFTCRSLSKGQITTCTCVYIKLI